MEQENLLVNLARRIWSESEPSKERFTSVEKIDFTVLQDICENYRLDEFENIVRALTGGRILIIKNCFTAAEINKLKTIGLNLMNTTKSTFYKMDSEIPNFWRDITTEHSHKYGVPVVKKSMYFFHWNGESDLFEMINKRWDLIKILGGRASAFGKSTFPKDGYIDRIQLVQYPSGSGYLAPHQDPEHNQRCFISGYMSKQGQDFISGGFWAMNTENEKINLEHEVEIGDMGIGAARIIHGVDQIDDNKASERWFLGLYTNDSDCVRNRITLEAPKIAT